MKQLMLPTIKPETPTVIVSYKHGFGKYAVIMGYGGAYWWFPAIPGTHILGPFSKEEAMKEATRWADV